MKKVRKKIIVTVRLLSNVIWSHKKISIAALVLLMVLFFLFLPQSQPQVSTEQVKRGDISVSVSANGTIIAKRFANLNFSIPGTLAYLGVEKGDEVLAYQTIGVLDQREAQKNLELKLRDYSLARNTFDQTQEDNQNRRPFEALNDKMKRVLENNQYNLEKAVLSIELSDLVKQESVLTSPISGIVTRADVNTSGVYVSPSTIFIVVDPKSLIFSLEVDEVDISRIKVEQKVRITVDAYSENTFILPVDRIDFASHQTATGATAYTVEVELPNSGEFAYRIGMNGSGEIVVDEKKDTLYISSISIVDNKYVYVKGDDGVRKQEISVGLEGDLHTEVVAGLNEGDLVLTDIGNIESKLRERRFFLLGILGR